MPTDEKTLATPAATRLARRTAPRARARAGALLVAIAAAAALLPGCAAGHHCVLRAPDAQLSAEAHALLASRAPTLAGPLPVSATVRP